MGIRNGTLQHFSRQCMLNCAVEMGVPCPSWQTCVSQDTQANRWQRRAGWSGKALPLTCPWAQRSSQLISWAPSQMVMRAHWASSHLTSLGWEKWHLSTPSHQWPLADNVEDAKSQHHIPFCCPCPEVRIWRPNILGWAVKQPNLSPNRFSQYRSAGESLKNTSCFQVEFIQKMASVSANSRKCHVIKRSLPVFPCTAIQKDS